jgi:hypothetical protein
MPTLEHFPRPKREGGRKALDNAILARRLCNRIDFFIHIGRSHRRDLERIRKAREAAIRRHNETPHAPGAEDVSSLRDRRGGTIRFERSEVPPEDVR